MNTCRRCKVETKDFHVLRLGGIANENACVSRSIGGKYNFRQDTYNVTLCTDCSDKVMEALEKCFVEV